MKTIAMKLLNSFSIDVSIKNKVNDLISDNKVIFNNWSKKDGVYNLAYSLVLAEETYKKYKLLGISDEIFFDTMKDIEIWVNNSNGRGLINYSWIENHLNLSLFKIGRLQFQLFKCKDKSLRYNKLPFKYGDNVVYIHIPQGEKLNINNCIISIKLANKFFAEYFSEFEYKYYFCESWLLFENNNKIMDENSNIIKFQKLFHICYNIKNNSQAKERIFGNKKVKSFYERETLLHKNARKFLKFHRLGLGIGVIKKDEY